MGIVAHNDLIGAYEGSTVFGSTGRRFLVVRPTLSDMVLKMPRGAQVIYPKDLAAILMEADISPGIRVLEAGVGSGALSMALLRAGASVVGYELREDFANRAHNNVAGMVGEDADYRVELRDVYEGIEERGLDRMVLDLPEPWRVVPHAEVGAAVRRHHLRLPPDHQPDGPVPAGPGGQRLRHGRHPRGAAPDLAHRGPLGPTRPPHGRATPGSSPRPGSCVPRSWAAGPAVPSAGWLRGVGGRRPERRRHRTTDDMPADDPEHAMARTATAWPPVGSPRASKVDP